jgi:hypothetical protein
VKGKKIHSKSCVGGKNRLARGYLNRRHRCKVERSIHIILMHKIAKFNVLWQSSLSPCGSEIIKYPTYNTLHVHKVNYF